jgi:site-specific DNA-adenine methylase
MFSYYGSKSKIVNLYPPPKHDRIIEPFAGSARYSLKYWQKDVLLVDKYDVVVTIWQWLQKCSTNDIMKLPKLTKGLDIRTLNLSEEERLFLGMVIAGGSLQPRFTVSPFGDYEHGNQNLYKNVAQNLHKIKHWTVQLGTYDEIPNFEATWFIDPPYQCGGEYYRFSSKELDFEHLGRWCMNRSGHVIVCENTKANWLPFKPMQKIQGVGNTNTVEAIWSNQITNYDNEQGVLF